MFQRDYRQNAAAGFSLIEVMIATLVLAIGAAGLSLLLLTSVKGTAQAQERSEATRQAAELAQLIHANPAVWGHLVHTREGPGACSPEGACPQQAWAELHLQQWQRELQGSISAARGIICEDSSPLDGNLADLGCDGQGGAVVKVVWQEAAGSGPAAELQRLALPLPQ